MELYNIDGEKANNPLISIYIVNCTISTLISVFYVTMSTWMHSLINTCDLMSTAN